MAGDPKNPLDALHCRNGNVVEHLHYLDLEEQMGGVLARAELSKTAEGYDWVRGHMRDGKYVPGYRRMGKRERKMFAPGLPDRKKVTPFPTVEPGKPRVMEFGVHDHHARRAGRHFDLRIGDRRTDIAHSWAIPKARLPEPGERLLAIRQPDHTVGYMDFSGLLCLPPGSRVSTSDGLVPIEELQPGRHEILGVGSRGLALYPLKRLYAGSALRSWVRVQLDEDGGEGRSLLCGPKHLLYVAGEGLIKAEDLAVGDTVVTHGLADALIHGRVTGGAEKEEVGRVVRATEHERDNVVYGKAPACATSSAEDIPLDHELSGLVPTQPAAMPAVLEDSPTDRSAASVGSDVQPLECLGHGLPVHPEAVSYFLDGQTVRVIEPNQEVTVVQLGCGCHLELDRTPRTPSCQVRNDELAEVASVVDLPDPVGDGGLGEAVPVRDVGHCEPFLEEGPDLPQGDHARLPLVRTEPAHVSPPNIRYSRVQVVEEVKQILPRWDIEVEDAHNYFAEGILTHNSEGYGMGRVDLPIRSRCEVVEADENKVRVNYYKGREITELLLFRTKGDKWIVTNTTPVRRPDLPDAKPKYKERDPKDVGTDDDGEIVQAKVDGAHVLIDLKPGKQARVFSYRPTSRKTGIIDHTWRLPGVIGAKTSKETGETVLRGEVYATKDGKPVQAQRVGGMLNSEVWNSRMLQDEDGELSVAAFDLVRYKGRPAEDMPYAEKLRIIKEIVARGEVPGLHVPDTAETSKEKARLLKEIREGGHGQTSEGVIVWRKDESAPPTKAKHRPDHDVHVRGIFPAKGKDGRELDRAGGFTYSHTPTGPIVGRVGTGFDHKTLREMKAKPSRFVGRVAKVRSQERHKSGALRAPSFSEWHLDKGMDKESISKKDLQTLAEAGQKITWPLKNKLEKALRGVVATPLAVAERARQGTPGSPGRMHKALRKEVGLPETAPMKDLVREEIAGREGVRRVVRELSDSPGAAAAGAAALPLPAPGTSVLAAGAVRKAGRRLSRKLELKERPGLKHETSQSAKELRDLFKKEAAKRKRKLDWGEVLPAVGATIGGAVALRKGKAAKLTDVIRSAGAGATTGWLPKVYRDAAEELRKSAARKPVPRVCHYKGCKEPATKSVIWADGRGRCVCCQGHVRHYQKTLSEVVATRDYHPDVESALINRPKGESRTRHRKKQVKLRRIAKALNRHWTPTKVHKLCEQLKIRWDDHPPFMRRCEKLTGKRRLDDMGPEELRKVAIDLIKWRYHPTVPPKSRIKLAIINVRHATGDVLSSLTEYERALVDDMRRTGDDVVAEGDGYTYRGHEVLPDAVRELVGAGYLDDGGSLSEDLVEKLAAPEGWVELIKEVSEELADHGYRLRVVPEMGSYAAQDERNKVIYLARSRRGVPVSLQDAAWSAFHDLMHVIDGRSDAEYLCDFRPSIAHEIECDDYGMERAKDFLTRHGLPHEFTRKGYRDPLHAAQWLEGLNRGRGFSLLDADQVTAIAKHLGKDAGKLEGMAREELWDAVLRMVGEVTGEKTASSVPEPGEFLRRVRKMKIKRRERRPDRALQRAAEERERWEDKERTGVEPHPPAIIARRAAESL